MALLIEEDIRPVLSVMTRGSYCVLGPNFTGKEKE